LRRLKPPEAGLKAGLDQHVYYNTLGLISNKQAELAKIPPVFIIFPNLWVDNPTI
jgi:hypothetical protein